MATILIIDDEPQMRLLVARVLRSAGHDVTEAKNGAEGLEVFRAMRQELVITDLFMPETEGIETLRELRQMAPEVRVIVMSGGYASATVMYLDMATKLGADGTLEKPFLPSALLKMVGELCRKEA